MPDAVQSRTKFIQSPLDFMAALNISNVSDESCDGGISLFCFREQPLGRIPVAHFEF